MNIAQTLADRAKRYSGKPALIFQDQALSFQKLQENVLRVASVLQRCGVKKSDKIAIFLPNCPEYVYSYLACFVLGTVCVPLDYMLKMDELSSCLGHAEIKALIAQENTDISLKNLKKEVPSLEIMIVCGRKIPETLFFDDCLSQPADDLPAVPIFDHDPALVMYTSGTTGQPKGILLNYKHLEGSPGPWNILWIYPTVMSNCALCL